MRKGSQSNKNAYNQYVKKKTRENKINYKRFKDLVKKTVREQKRESWLKYLNTINYEIKLTPAKRVWQKIKAVEGKGYFSPCTLKEKDKIISDAQSAANILGKQFSNNSSDNNYNAEF